MSKTRKIIFIMTNTQRYDMLGCYGNKDMSTPNLDNLASKGMLFERAYCCQPVCGPARAALFTGTFPHTNGSWGNSMQLGVDIKTTGQLLKDAGIHTAYMGKWHLDAGDYFGLGRCPDGWDYEYWYDMRNFLEEFDNETRLKFRNTNTMLQEDIPIEDTFAHRVCNRAESFLEKHGSEDFFMVVSLDEPHGPFLCPEPFASMYKDYQFPKSKAVWDRLEGKPDSQIAWAGDRINEDKDNIDMSDRFYLGCNSFADYEIGRVLKSAHKYAPDALIIYTADHGHFMKTHSLFTKGAAFYDDIARIPLIIKWPDVISGSVCKYPSSHIDILPTILEAADIKIPYILQGKSMIPALVNPEVRINNYVFCEFNRYELWVDGGGAFQPMRSVFDGRYKLSVNLLSTDELYDIESDPEEMINLIDSDVHANERDRLHDAVLNWMNDTIDPFRGYYWERRPWRKDARPATWSYTGYDRYVENELDQPRFLDYNTGLPVKEFVWKK